MQPTKKLPTRFIGVDYGLARIGLSVSDERKIIAMPLLTLVAERKIDWTAAKLLATVQAEADKGGYTVEAMVLGLPLRMSGKKGVIADEVVDFAELLKVTAAYPIVLWDERLTSVQAERSMLEANLSRKHRSRLSDTVAAVIILQSYLDSLTVGS